MVDEHGRIVPPKELRETYEARTGDEAIIIAKNKELSIHLYKTPKDPLEHLRNIQNNNHRTINGRTENSKRRSPQRRMRSTGGNAKKSTGQQNVPKYRIFLHKKAEKLAATAKTILTKTTRLTNDAETFQKNPRNRTRRKTLILRFKPHLIRRGNSTHTHYKGQRTQNKSPKTRKSHDNHSAITTEKHHKNSHI